MTLRRKVVYWLLMLSIAAFGGFYIAEFVFRQAVAVHTVPRTQRGFDQLVANEWPQPVLRAKQPGTIRILGLADSFGLAGGADNYHYQLERLLRERGHDVEVVNMSVAAYSLDQELRLLRGFGAVYEPDLVLHAFFVGNDFSASEGESMRFRGIEVDVAPSAASWLPHNLVLPRWFGRWMTARGDRRQQDRETDQGIERGSLSRESFLRIGRVRMSTCRRPTRDGIAWPTVVRALDEIAAEADRLGARRVMVVHPDQFQIEPALAAEVMREYSLDPADYDLDLPQAFLRAYADSRRVPLIDLTERFRGEGSGGGLYLLRDTHYNERGNRLAAEMIADRLEPILVDLAS